MKTLYIVPILAIVLVMAGCTSGSTGKTVYVTEQESVPTEAEALPAEATEPLEVKLVPAEQPATSNGSRIDAVSFLEALVESGCEIDKAEYKEVIRGGGIIVSCKGSTDALEMEGLEGL